MENPTDISIQKIIQDQDKVFVIPMIEQSILSSVLANQEQSFQYLDQYISSLINLSHQILIYNHLEVENVVYFNGEKFLAFENWFIQKYQGRVAGTKINYQANESVSSVIKEPDTIDNTMTLAASIAQDEKVEMPSSTEVEIGEKEEQTHEFGFVSYVLLGVIVAVVSLVFLYLII